MPYSYIQENRIRIFFRQFMLVLLVLAVINGLRIYWLDGSRITFGHISILTLLFIVSFVVNLRFLILCFLGFSLFSMIYGHFQLNQYTLAGILLPVLGPPLAYYLNFRSVIMLLLGYFVIGSSIFYMLLDNNSNFHDTSFFIMKLLILVTATGLTARFFDKFAHIFDNQVNEERSLRKAFESQANYDELTSVLSRRGIFQAVKNLNENTNYAIILLDIDYFKSVNDLSGHNVGDIYLQEFAGTLKSILPEGYLLGRIGGEEFMVIAPSDDETAIKQFVVACLVEIENLHIEIESGDLTRTCSIGVCIHNKRLSLNVGLKYADTALYQAKIAGRNQSAWFTTGE